MTRKHVRTPTQRTRILYALIGSNIFILLSQYIVWRGLNPFQSSSRDNPRNVSAPPWDVDETRQDDSSTASHHDKVRVGDGLGEVRPSSNAARHFNLLRQVDESKPFCLGWSPGDGLNRTLQPFDHWWAHHPTWLISNETDDMFCMEPGDEGSSMMQSFKMFFETQFNSTCDKLHWRMMWSSGWGADLFNVQCGLITSSKNLHIPLVMGLSSPWMSGPEKERGIWHYAANKDDHSNKTCPQADLTCYFVPYHNCGSLDEIEDRVDSIKFVENEELSEECDISDVLGQHANAYVTRKQLWLRRAVFDFKKEFKSRYNSESDCTVIHVRRSDVILHSKWSRKYYPVTDYVQLIPRSRRRNVNHTILLLTDDANAIIEAHEFHPELRWKYINRTRYKGSSGGWERHTPSRNPASEVITLLATFELVQECSMLIHGSSKFSEMLWFMMSSAREDAKQRRVDANENDVFSDAHMSSELQLMKKLNELREGRMSHNVSSLEIRGGPYERVSENTTLNREGLIIVNMLGLLANDLFEAAFAARLSEQLGWRVVYRTMWNAAFPTVKTDLCFPNIARKHIASADKYSDKDPLWNFLLDYGGDRESFELRELYDALTYNDLEEFSNLITTQDEANEIQMAWIDGLGEKVKRIAHLQYPLQDYNVDTLVEDLKSPHSEVRVLQLEAFFIHFDWMKEWMGPQHIPHWLQILQNRTCCPTPPPKRDTIVIHIRDFDPEDDDKNKHLQVGVFLDIINKYYKTKDSGREIWVVCQPKSIKSDIVQDLVKKLGAKVHTGADNIDAFCILSRARIHIPTTSSSFSQLAALLAEERIREKYGNFSQVEVHYPTHTLEYPMVTLKVPGWKYHLTNNETDGIAEFDVDHSRLQVAQA
eukprot:CCRYP_005665-RA/>CCRYP_005665-RA protein AED:0.17 eAED:0.17 QI:292/1/1/1/0.83/0.71/7/853/877